MADTDGYSEVQRFYQDAVIFITGATGFLGKVLVEKLLRSCQGIKKIYLLIRRKNESNSPERLALLLKSECFERLHQECPASLNKLAVVDGDLAEENLGLNIGDYQRLASEVSVVFHCAATTRLKNTLRNAVKVNVEGTKSVLELCHLMKGMKAIVHVSTVFVNCEEYTLEEQIYPSTVKADDIISLARCMHQQQLGRHPPVYNCASGTINKLSYDQVESLTNKMLRKHPAKARFGRPGLKLTKSRFYYAVTVFVFNYLPALFFDFVLKITGRKARVYL
ncbi:fatty acyl-CoA reductase 1-like [Ixodes scapularis]|uniref:fatty acyl-CoA reductase 1-like n=1 Tax=Ixodes scapularis TaxID=6945 RepID=UPI001A9DA7FA|nr:fatty acyl-CoA reductase 1-like [Ixodes scapularis]